MEGLLAVARRCSVSQRSFSQSPSPNFSFFNRKSQSLSLASSSSLYFLMTAATLGFGGNFPINVPSLICFMQFHMSPPPGPFANLISIRILAMSVSQVSWRCFIASLSCFTRRSSMLYWSHIAHISGWIVPSGTMYWAYFSLFSASSAHFPASLT